MAFLSRTISSITKQLHPTSRVIKRLKSTSAPFSTQLQPAPKDSIPEDEGIKRQSTLIDPFKHPDYFHVHNMFTVRDLFDARVHYGHKEGSFNDKMKPFVFGSRLGHIIFDLDITAFHLRQALNFVAHIAFHDGVILFVCQKPEFTLLVERTALECKEFAIAREWRDGIITNSTVVFGEMIRLPELCIVLNTLNTVLSQHPIITDAAKLLIPTVAIVDSNCDPNLVTYPIPGNDDSFSAMQLYCRLFKEAILRGKNERQRLLQEEEKMLSSGSEKS